MCVCQSCSSFVWGFIFQGLPATGLHHHMQSEVCTNCHPASSKSMSQPRETRSGYRPQQHRSVRCNLFLQAPQWPSCAVRKQFSKESCWIRATHDYLPRPGGVMMNACAMAYNTDCSASPIRSLPLNDRIRYRASQWRHETNSDWILPVFFDITCAQRWAVFEILVFQTRILKYFLYLVFEILQIEYLVFWYFKHFFQ